MRSPLPSAFRVALLGSALVPLVAASAAAQSWMRPGGTAVQGRVYVSGELLCNHSAALTFDRTCLAPGTRAEINATVGADRRLHAEASLLDSRFRSHDQPIASAEARYGERLTFTGPVIPEYVRFTLFLHGSVGGTSNSYGALTMWSTSSEPRVSIGIHGNGPNLPPPVSTGPKPPVPSPQWERRTIDLPVVNGRVDFALALVAHAHLPVRIDEGEVHCPAGACPVRAARSDFSQTAGLELIEGFDASGAAITGGLRLATATGARYALVGAAPTSTVPEPGTWALLGTGLVAVGVAARRRKAAQSA